MSPNHFQVVLYARLLYIVTVLSWRLTGVDEGDVYWPGMRLWLCKGSGA
jgi:hypothetical protein